MNFIVALIGLAIGVYGVVNLAKLGYNEREFKTMIYAVVASMTIGLIYGMLFNKWIG